MAREYGGSAESFAWWRGSLVPGARMVLWADRDRSEPITDLVTTSGEPITEGFVRADDRGHYRFATVAEHQTIYGEILGGDGLLYRIDRADIGGRVFGVEAEVQTVGGVAHQALQSSQEASGKADAAHSLVTDELGRVNTGDGLARLNADGKVPAGLLPSHTEAFLTWGDYPTIGAEVWPTPVGFRGMGTAGQQGAAPENSLEGMRAYVDLHPLVPGQQAPVLWLDAFVVNDGSTLVCRGEPGGDWAGDVPTLTKRIHPQDLTSVTARTARISGSKWGAGWPDLPMPSLEDVFAEFAGRALFVLQVAKPGNVIGNLWRTVLNFGMEDSVLVCGDTDNLGITPGERSREMVLFDQVAATPGELQDVAEAGIEWVGLHCSGVNPINGVEQISAARAAGLRVMAYPLTRHYELDRCQEAGDAANPWGVDAIVTPDPIYCRWPLERPNVFGDAPWFGGYAPGHLGNGDGADAPVRARPYLNSFQGTWALLYLVNDPTGTENADQLMDPDGYLAYWEHQGWAYRDWYEHNPDTTRLRVDVTYMFRGGPSTAWLGVMVLSDDRPARYQGTGSVITQGPPGQNGWQVVVRPDGNLYLRRITDGQLSDEDVAEVTTGPGEVFPGPWSEYRRVRLELFPDRVEASLMSEFGTTVYRSLSYPDTSMGHRGPYVAFGSRSAELMISDASVTTPTVGV